MTANKNVTITSFINGPYALVVSKPDAPDDEQYPMVISPPDGFVTTQDAVDFATRFTGRNLGLFFNVAAFRDMDSFIGYCSWEE